MHRPRHDHPWKFLLVFLVLFTGVHSVASDTLTCREAREDVRFLVNAIESTHPDPYTAFGGKIAFKRALMDLLEEVPENGMTVSELYRRLRLFVTRLADMHTRLDGPSGTDNDITEGYLPVRFKAASDGLFISSAKVGYESLIGARVVSVNAAGLDSLGARLARLVAAENRYGLLRRMAIDLRYRSSLADLLPEADSVLHFGLTLTDGRHDSASIPLLPGEEYASLAWEELVMRPDVVSDGLLAAQFLDDHEKIAYLWLAELATREAFQIARSNRSSYLQSSLDRLYRRILRKDRSDDLDEAIVGVPSLCELLVDLLRQMEHQGSTHLIIDLRSNGGGWTESIIPLLYMLYGDSYFGYDFPVQWCYNVSPLYLDKFQTTMDEFNDGKGMPLQEGDYYFEPGDTLAESRDRRNRYLQDLLARDLEYAAHLSDLDGEPICSPQVVVLVSPGTGSAAYHLYYYLSHMGAVTVGVPPAQAGNAFMDLTPITLPRSGLKAYVAHSAVVMFPNDSEKGRIFRPDFELSYEAYARYGFAEDTEILYTLDLIESGEI